MLKVTFVYCPRSGDRVFLDIPGDDLRVTRWENGCRHIEGGIHVWWETAHPGRWWRDTARALLSALVTEGVCWDEQGVIHAVLAGPYAIDIIYALDGMAERRHAPTCLADEGLVAELVAAGHLVPGVGRLAMLAGVGFGWADPLALPTPGWGDIPRPVYRDAVPVAERLASLAADIAAQAELVAALALDGAIVE